MPRIRWVPVGKSNCYLDVERSQSNPIYKIAVDILKNTNFFSAFIASSTISSIYIHQFWDTVRYDKITGCYRCQLDEQWFDLTKDTLRDALQITPVDTNNPFSSPLTPDALIKFVNDLGYPKVVGTLSDVVTNDMFQPWRALTTIINLCLTGKTSGFERPRASVLQILWDVGKKKATLIVISSVRFTKLIVYYLQSKHKFHPRPSSPLHLPNEEPVLGYLKFSAKGTKQEVFGMPIPNDLITDDIRGKQYYNAYLEKVAKHQRYLVGEEVSDPDSPAPKPAKATKSKAAKQSKPLSPKSTPITKPAATKASKSQQPKPAHAKPQEKKRKLVTETSEVPSPAKRSKADKEQLYGDEEADMQRAIEESLKEVHGAHRGPLPPVVFREPNSGKHQPLPETPKKKSPADQYIFQRRTSTQTKPSCHDESSSLYAELGLTDSETESDEEVLPVIQSGAQDESHAGPNPGIQDEGQAGSNPGDAALSQPQSSHAVHARPNLEHMDFENLKLPTEDQVRLEESVSSAGTLSSLQNFDKELSFANQFLVEKSQEDDTYSVPLMTTPVIDLTVSQPVSTTVQAPLPISIATVTTITTTSLPPIPPQPQQGSSDSILIQRIGELEQHMADMVSKVADEIVTYAVDLAIQAPLKDYFRDLPEADMKEILHHRMWGSNSYQAHEDHKMLYEALEKSMARDHTDQLLTDLAKTRRKKKKRHDSPKTPPGSPPHQPPPPPPPTGSSGTSRASRASGSSQLPPPPPPPSTNQSDQSKSTDAPSSSKTAASAEYTAWTNTDSRLNPSVSSILEDLYMDADSALDKQVYSLDDEDIGHDHIPKVSLKQDWWKPLSEEDRPATPEPAWSIPSSDQPIPMNNWASVLSSTYAPPPENSLLAHTDDMTTFMDWYCKRQGLTELTQKDLKGPTFEIVKVFHPDVIHLQYQMEECHKLLTDQVDDAILLYGSKGSRPALSISKMKAAYYPDVGLEQMVPDQMWIEEECKYDVAAMYGISHWWFQRQRFYIDRHTSKGDHRGVQTHMRILSVLRIEVFSLYGYDYMKKIVLRRADLQEHIIAERDFKYLYPSDFEDLYLLNLQGHLNHLPPKDKKILTTAVNLWTRNLVIRQRHDFTVIDSLRAVTFRDKYGVQMIMRFNEIHKFSDGTLQHIDEALDYRVKEFKVNMMNPGLNTRFWSMKDVDRSKEFMFAIQKRLKTRRIFRNLESFIGG
ncbi:monodehydroascorbate reductase [Tanacetum coccineum]